MTFADPSVTPATPAPQSKLLDQPRAHIRKHHYSIHTKEVYADRARRFILFHAVQKSLSHADVNTTTIYPHVLNKGGRGILSSLDAL